MFKAQAKMKSWGLIHIEAQFIREIGLDSRSRRTKMDAQTSYRFRFGRSRYAGKAKEISFPIQLESRLDSLGVDGNCRNNRTTRICHNYTACFG